MRLRAAWLLAPLLLCQGCLTRELWREHTNFVDDEQDSRGTALEHGFQRPHFAADGLIVQADADLREAFPEQVGDRARVLLAPAGNESTFTELSFLGRSIGAELRIAENTTGTPSDLELHCYLPVTSKRYAHLLDAPGATQRYPMFTSHFEVSVPLEIASASDVAVFEPGDRFGLLEVSTGRYVLNEESTLDHILWTPVTLLFDVVLSPFELLTIRHWW